MAPRVEYATDRRLRTRNTLLYRALHWPLWIFVFFLVPGPLVFDLFAGRPNRWNLLWLLLVLLGTGVAALRGCLPGAEPGPYILRFTEDRPNPLYRRVCYTFAWNAALNFALMNLLGNGIAVATGHWFMQQIYSWIYFPVLAAIVLLGVSGVLPRVRPSTAGEGSERRYFYGTVWSVTLAQAVLLVLWKTLPRSHDADLAKLGVYVAVLLAVGFAAAAGHLPRTRPILPGDLLVADLESATWGQGAPSEASTLGGAFHTKAKLAFLRRAPLHRTTMSGPARMSDVAELAGVSIMTVSRVLSGSSNVTEGLRQRVFDAVVQLRYQPNEVARSLREQRSRQIGVIVPYLFDAFFAVCAHAISTVARQQSYSVVLATSDEDQGTEIEEASRMLRRNVDGLVLIPAPGTATNRSLRGSEFARLPIVSVDRPLDGNRFDSVLVENERGMQLGAEHLLRLGHRRIAYIGANSQLYTFLRREHGYCQAMQNAGLEPQLALLSDVSEDSLEAVRSLLAGPAPPSAVLCANNLITRHVLHSLRTLGIEPPDAVALVGFDDFETADLLRPGITVIRQPVEELGRRAATRLFKRLSGSTGSGTTQQIVLPVDLIVRGSCGASRNATETAGPSDDAREKIKGSAQV